MASPLEDEQSTALFRMLQEALTNVTRHAQAQRVDIVLDCDERHLMLRVTDDGVGFKPDGRKTHSFGLVGIHERALILGGSAKIQSQPGAGTSVEVSIPRHLNERQLS
jgi:signal transduction histidine kinase